MPTFSKPKLKELPSVWRAPSRRMLNELKANKAVVLEQLGFYREHDRPADFGGKFRKQVQTEENAVLTEIAGALISAAAISASLSNSVLIATLVSVKTNPALISKKLFPSAVLWIIAQSYQRADEKRGTYWPDIYGDRPRNFKGTVRKPTAENVAASASRALISLRKGRTPGRPRNLAIEKLACSLGSIFRRYNSKLSRHSVVTSLGDGKFYQMDSGPFLEFIKTALKPLQAYLREHALSKVSAATVVKQVIALKAA